MSFSQAEAPDNASKVEATSPGILSLPQSIEVHIVLFSISLPSV